MLELDLFIVLQMHLALFYISPFCQCDSEILSHQWADSKSIFRISQVWENEIACGGGVGGGLRDL